MGARRNTAMETCETFICEYPFALLYEYGHGHNDNREAFCHGACSFVHGFVANFGTFDHAEERFVIRAWRDKTQLQAPH